MTGDAQSLTFLCLILPFLAALAAPWLTRLMAHRAAWVLALVPLFIFVHFGGMVTTIAAGLPVSGGYAWVPSLDLDFSWYLDGLSLGFALLISGIGTLIVLYSGGYLAGHEHQGRFVSFILMFMGSMQGLVVSDSFLMLFVFWELTSITSFLLIGFDHTRQASRRAAVQALIVTGGGGLSLLAALIVIWAASGHSSLSALLAEGDLLRHSPLFLASLILILGAAFTKSAQFPFHFWLPNAMEAPTPVSAYLHSATMVKAGVYLLMRLNPVMGDSAVWTSVLPLFGGATLAIGTILAVRQTDIKLMLAYTTVASLGLLVLLTGLGTQTAIAAAALYLIAHSMFKGALFMVAGALDHGAGSRDITQLGGLARLMPVTFGAAILAALSMGGLPPMFGFLAKEEIYAALAPSGVWMLALLAVAIMGNALMLAVGLAVGLKPFTGPRRASAAHVHEGSVLLLAGPVVLATAGLVSALFSATSHRLLSDPFASAVAGGPVSIHLSPVPHLGLPLFLSLGTIGLGLIVYWRLDRMRHQIARLLAAIGWGPDRGFDQLVQAMIRLAAGLTGLIQNGRLEIYMTVTFIVVACVLLVPMAGFGELPAMPAFPELAFYEWMVLAIALIGLFAVVQASNRLTAIVSLGIQGFAVALLFMLFGAPDLSFTQFMVETLSVVILALAMTRLNLSPSDHRPPLARTLDIAVSAACGIGFCLLLLKVTQLPFDDRLSQYFNANSYLLAHGRNVVNVIIVDFRGLDTLGEIAVVVIAGLAILALVRLRANRPAWEKREVKTP